MKKVTDDFRANSLLEAYLMMNPTKVRSQAELQELDAEYTRGEGVRPSKSASNTTQISVGLNMDSEDDISVSGDDMDYIFHGPCPTCDPNNRFGYVCPIPVPIAPGQRITHDLVAQGHKFCGCCGDLMPLRGVLEEICASCGTYSCHSIRGNECPHSKLTKFGGTMNFKI